MPLTPVDLLQSAGWVPGRTVEVSQLVRQLESDGYVVVAPAKAFLTEFGGLVISSEDGRKTVRTYGAEYATPPGAEWCSEYEKAILRPVCPVAEYSHMTIMIDVLGAFWGAFDQLYGSLGESFLEALHCVLIDRGTKELNRVLDIR